MTTRKSVQRIWQDTASGLVVPQGIVSDHSDSSSQTYLDIKEKALALERLYSDSAVALSALSSLGRLIADAKDLSGSWLMGQAEKHPMTLLFRVGLFDRIVDAVLPLRDVPDRARFLATLASGTLDLLERTRSNAKDILWELELWATLKRRSFGATLQEPPDIVVHFGKTRIGIACKKLYSDKHVQNVLSQAVAQIEAGFDLGIVAVNIDDLIPANQILQTPSHESMTQFIRDINARFLASHERHFRKYLASGRVISAMVSTSVLV